MHRFPILALISLLSPGSAADIHLCTHSWFPVGAHLNNRANTTALEYVHNIT